LYNLDIYIIRHTSNSTEVLVNYHNIFVLMGKMACNVETDLTRANNYDFQMIKLLLVLRSAINIYVFKNPCNY